MASEGKPMRWSQLEKRMPNRSVAGPFAQPKPRGPFRTQINGQEVDTNTTWTQSHPITLFLPSNSTSRKMLFKTRLSLLLLLSQAFHFANLVNCEDKFLVPLALGVISSIIADLIGNMGFFEWLFGGCTNAYEQFTCNTVKTVMDQNGRAACIVKSHSSYEVNGTFQMVNNVRPNNGLWCNDSYNLFISRCNSQDPLKLTMKSDGGFQNLCCFGAAFNKTVDRVYTPLCASDAS